MTSTTFQHVAPEYPNADETNPISVITDVLDFKERGLKTIGHIEVGYTKITALLVSLYYRYDDGAFTQSAEIGVNDEGVAYLGITGKDFKIAFTGTSSTLAKLDYCKIHYKQRDRRYRRGIGD